MSALADLLLTFLGGVALTLIILAIGRRINAWLKQLDDRMNHDR